MPKFPCYNYTGSINNSGIIKINFVAISPGVFPNIWSFVAFDISVVFFLRGFKRCFCFFDITTRTRRARNYIHDITLLIGLGRNLGTLKRYCNVVSGILETWMWYCPRFLVSGSVVPLIYGRTANCYDLKGRPIWKTEASSSGKGLKYFLGKLLEWRGKEIRSILQTFVTKSPNICKCGLVSWIHQYLNFHYRIVKQGLTKPSKY